MEVSLLRKMPPTVIKKYIIMTWADVIWGLNHNMINTEVAIALAVEEVLAGTEEQAVVLLASLLNRESYKAYEIITRLANQGTTDDQRSRLKWIYLRLQWLYDNREFVSDPIRDLDSLAIEFGEASEILDLVTVSSVNDVTKQSLNKVYRRWASTLLELRQFLGSDEESRNNITN